MTSITRILTCLPKQRRTGLFSATMTDGLSELVRVGLRNPVRVVVKVEAKRGGVKRKANEVVEERRIPARLVPYRFFLAARFTVCSLQNYWVACKTSEKMIQLVRIIEHERRTNDAAKFIVYFATCACVDYFYRVS